MQTGSEIQIHLNISHLKMCSLMHFASQHNHALLLNVSNIQKFENQTLGLVFRSSSE